jgi:hypothetical protein
MCKHSGGMLVVLLSCILLLQQNHTQNFWNDSHKYEIKQNKN